MSKPIVGIVSSKIITQIEPFIGDVKSCVTIDYIRAIEKSGGIPIQIPITQDMENIHKYVEICDSFLFTGGPDIHPYYYKESPRINIGKIHADLDEYQMKLLKCALDSDKTILGICRGCQLLNIISGGTLIQDLSESNITIKHYMDCERHVICHNLKIKENSFLSDIFGDEIYVNSFHHQVIGKLGDGLEVIASATDGVIEGIRAKNKRFVIGIQWHPEMMLTSNDDMLPLFEMFINQSKPCDIKMK